LHQFEGEQSPTPGTVLPSDDGFWQVATPREARRRLLEMLRLELLGPEAPEEKVRESPLTRYATGMLAPFGTDIPDDERDDQLTTRGDDEEAGSVDFGPPMSQAITPSSIGLSFLVPSGTGKLTVLAKWGDYRVEEIPAKDTEVSDSERDTHDGEEAKEKPRRRRPRLLWARTPH
jgi:hypothetical protein